MSSFIDQIKHGAIATWHSHRVLPSISIAQAILESGWGKSELATKANAVFGIKVSPDWTGGTYNVDTREVVNGNTIIVNAAFRAYNSWADSIIDHGAFFKSTPWRATNYAAVVGETNYKRAAQALQSAGYATDPGYAMRLINLIEQYDLARFDSLAEEGGKSVGKHLIIAGHGLKSNGVYDPGASPASTGYREADVVRESLIPAMRKFDGGQLDYITEYDVYDRGNIGGFTGYDSITELHFNSSNDPRAVGVELCIYGDYQPDDTDINIVESLARFYVKRRFGQYYKDLGGFFPRYDLQNCNICAKQGITYRLVETCFISNPDEMQTFFANVDSIAQGLVKAIIGPQAAPPTAAEMEVQMRPEVIKWVEGLYDRAQNPDAPEWAAADLQQAIDAGITTGERPNDMPTRAETAIMVLRAAKDK